MKQRHSKAERIIDRRIEVAYGRACSGIQIDIFDISRVFAAGRAAIAAGADDAALETALLAVVNTVRKN